jgi:FkbM family methyltransferase
MNTEGIECVVLDAGARYGLHPTWAEVRTIATFHLFEMDPAEAARLTRKYGNERNIKVHAIALFSKDATLRANVSQHRALNSLYSTDGDLLNRNDYMTDRFAVLGELEVAARTIDSIFQDQPIHFFKLDIEGSELDALKGAGRALRNSVLGVRSEVCFAPIYKAAPLFGDVHHYLLEQGFELLNLDYTGQGNKAGRFTCPGRYGKLISSDAVWVIGNDRLFAHRGAALIDNVVRMSMFLMLNNAADLAIDTLLKAVTTAGVSFDTVRKTPLFVALHRKALLHFKDLSMLPMFDHAELFETYQTIFNLEFPALNQFYESDVFA